MKEDKMTNKTAVDGLVDALEEAQWAEYYDSDYGNQVFCPECRAEKRHGHSEDCTIAAALAAYRASQQEPKCKHGNWIDCAECDLPSSSQPSQQEPAREYPSREEVEAMAHRTAARYRHGEDFPYLFAAHSLEEFARRIIDWHTAQLLKQEPAATVCNDYNQDGTSSRIDQYLPAGTRLYARPIPAKAEAKVPQSIQNTIGELLAEAMNNAARNGANSISMPDEYVELAAWLAARSDAEAQVPIATVHRDYTGAYFLTPETGVQLSKYLGARVFARPAISEEQVK